jgi:sugar lactone lactonase YvrE
MSSTTLQCAIAGDDVLGETPLWCSDMQSLLWLDIERSRLHRFHPGTGRHDRFDFADGTAQRLFGDVILANTVALSPAQDVLYFSDTRRFITWRFALDLATGTLSDRQVFVDHTATRSRPHGACVDRDGHVWTAMFGGGRIVRYAPTGVVDRVIELPVTNPTCVCLGGPGLKTLYITPARTFLDEAQLAAEPWAGSVLAIDVDVPGLPECRFGAVHWTAPAAATA